MADLRGFGLRAGGLRAGSGVGGFQEVSPRKNAFYRGAVGEDSGLGAGGLRAGGDVGGFRTSERIACRDSAVGKDSGVDRLRAAFEAGREWRERTGADGFWWWVTGMVSSDAGDGRRVFAGADRDLRVFALCDVY